MSGGDGTTLGFLGGSFDPPHIGHLILARDAFEQLSLDKIYLVPAVQSPLRGRPHIASFDDRMAMCRLAVRGHPWLDVLDVERDLPSPSYTVNTARKLAELFPGAALVWLLGADQWEMLPQWHDYETLVGLLRFAVAARPGHKLTALPFPEPKAVPLRTREIEVSSTELRERLYCKLPVDTMTPPGVADYIASHGLYLHH
jgi:nicotinate-nucleotide adenylyltransferase